MKRRAFIIEASKVPGEDDLPGARADALSYREWLMTNPGGRWYESEIITLSTPTIGELRRAIANEGKSDYVFLAFSGHGYHSKELDETKLCLYDGRITVYEVVPDADRCTFVVDACRNVMSERIFESAQLSTNALRKYARFAERRNFRADFETQVANAEKGTIYLFSCDLDESAGESALGGFFSRLLIRSGREFAENNADGTSWLPTNKAHDAAAVMTTARHRQQNPQYQGGRRLRHFPFAV